MALALLTVAVGGCRAPRSAEPGSPPSKVPQPAPTTATTLADDNGVPADSPAGGELTPERRAQLGLPQPGQDPAALAPLSIGQWQDPVSVATRFVLVETNYSAGDDQAVLAGRRRPYVSDGLAQEMEASSSAAAGLEALRRSGARFSGEIVSATTSERSGTTAVVDITARRSTTFAGGASESRIAFYRLTLTYSPTARWAVVRVERS